MRYEHFPLFTHGISISLYLGCSQQLLAWLSALDIRGVRDVVSVLSICVLPLQLLEDTERATISFNRVQVRALDRADGGVYTCTFKNIVGQVSHIIKLVIEGIVPTTCILVFVCYFFYVCA